MGGGWTVSNVTTLAFFVPCLPVAQPRQRHALRRRANGAMSIANYTPKDHPVTSMKQAVQLVAKSEMKKRKITQFDGPVHVDVVAWFPRPVSKVWKTKPMPAYWHTSKPDRDNLDKAVLDSMTGVVFRDDSQVCSGHVEKRVVAGSDKCGLVITVISLLEGME